MSGTFPVHNGGVWKGSNPSAHSGGAWHQVQTAWARSGGVWTAVWVNQTTDNFNFTADTHTGALTTTGYNDGTSGAAFGTMNSGGTLTGGKIIASIIESSAGNGSFSIRGFSADPGQTSVVNFTLPGGSVTGAQGGYSYSAGTATWSYPLTTYGAVFNFTVGNSYAGTIVHSFR
jgi:hypothetical protein